MTLPAVVTLGEAMISLRSKGFIRLADDFGCSVSGAETNIAIALARLGHQVAWLGALGTDEPAEMITRILRGEGVDSRVRRDADRPTGLMLIEKRLSTTARVTYHRTGSAGSQLRPDDLDGVLVNGVQWLHLTGITPALSESALQTTRAAIELARGNGTKISFDLNYRAKLWSAERAAPVLSELSRGVDLLVASEEELGLLGEGDEERLVENCLAAGTSTVVIKRGAVGVSVFDTGGRHDEAAVAVPVIDTIGAGDAFTGGFLSGVLDQLEPSACARRGVEVAAFAVAAEGDWEGLPTRGELALIDMETGGTVR